jgi:hypothetical protein
LIDSIGDLHQTLRDRYGKDIQLKVIEPRRGLFGLPSLGFSMTSDVVAALEDRTLWSRIGL